MAAPGWLTTTGSNPAMFGWTGASLAPAASSGFNPAVAPAPTPTLNNPTLASRGNVAAPTPNYGSPISPTPQPMGLNNNGSLYSSLLSNIFGPGFSGMLGTGAGPGGPLYTGPTAPVGMPMGGGGRNDWSNGPTPEQAYALNLQAKSAATTAPLNALYQLMYNNAHETYGSPMETSASWFPSSQPGARTAAMDRAALQQAIGWNGVNSGVVRAGVAAGGSNTYAPAPTPAWGYASGYGQAPINNVRMPQQYAPAPSWNVGW